MLRNTQVAETLRFYGKPTYDIVAILAGAGAATPPGLAVTNVVIWTRNVVVAADLAINLAQDARAGRDIDTTIAKLHDKNDAVLMTLSSGRLTGSLFTSEQQGDPLPYRLRETLWLILAENDAILRMAQETRYSPSGRVNAMATRVFRWTEDLRSGLGN